MADKNIEIGFKTTADTSGADEAKKSIFGVEDAAKRADREMDVLEAKRRKNERESSQGKSLLGTDVTELAKKAAEKAGFEDQVKMVENVVGALGKNATAAAAPVAAIVATVSSATKAYQMLTETVTGFRDLEKSMTESGGQLGPALEREVQAIEATLKPIKSVVDEVKGSLERMWEAIKNPVDTFSGLGDLKKSLEESRDMAVKLDDLRKQMANDKQASLKGVYDEELGKLAEQEATMRRIAGLRAQMGSLEMQAANQEIEAAKLRGGDVALAEYNALATKLRTELADLGETLRQSEAEAGTARRQLDSAMILYQQAIKDGLDKVDPGKFSELSNAVDKAQKGLADAEQAVVDQRQIYDATRTNILRAAENELAKLDTSLKGPISDAAKKAGDEIYAQLKDAVTDAPKEAIQQIRVEAGAVTEAAGAKATEVQAAVTAERDGTVKAIGGLAPTPQDTAAIVGAVAEVGRAQAEQGGAMVAALATVSAGIGAVTTKLAAQQRQIEQLFGRIR